MGGRLLRIGVAALDIGCDIGRDIGRGLRLRAARAAGGECVLAEAPPDA